MARDGRLTGVASAAPSRPQAWSNLLTGRVSWLEVAVPAAVSCLVGLAVGVGLSALLVSALDLRSVTGGRQTPPLVLDWWVWGLPVALGLLARASVLIAGLPGRRVPLGPLMRLS